MKESDFGLYHTQLCKFGCYLRFFILGYVKELMSELLVVFSNGKANTTGSSIPDSLCSEFDRPDKKKAIEEKQTRFTQ